VSDLRKKAGALLLAALALGLATAAVASETAPTEPGAASPSPEAAATQAPPEAPAADGAQATAPEAARPAPVEVPPSPATVAAVAAPTPTAEPAPVPPPTEDLARQDGAVPPEPPPAPPVVDVVPALPPGSPTTTLPPGSAPEVHEKGAKNVPSLLTIADAPRKKEWEAEQGGRTASRFAIARRLTSRPDRLLVPRGSLPRAQKAFLWRLARDTWNGIQAISDNENGLILDNVRVVGGLVPPLALKVGDYTSITNIGLHLVAVAGARSVGLLSDADAQETASRLLDTLAVLPRYEGYFFNYYDTTSLEPTSSFISFVDTGWLVAGLMVTRQAFPALASLATEFLDDLDLSYFYDADSGLMSHGYYVNLDSLSAFVYGAFYTEARLGSLVAIGKGDAPASHWTAMKRAMRPRCSDGECPELHRFDYRTPAGKQLQASHFQWRDHQYVPSWGGSMFEALMPRLLLDEGRFAPRSLGPNGTAHATLQRLYATEVLGFPVWGMSPCMSPETGRYAEYGVRALGSHGYEEGVVTPHAAALALAVTPEQAAASLMETAKRYDSYGDFGFYDAVDPRSGKVAYEWLALDQLMLFVAVTNHLSGGDVQDLFAADPFVKAALPLLGEERYFE
jgi:hypothetical protein